ncbi:hypothetical protein SteCoe_13383 [Stentor coeruleus]|uniref:EF-hand domain-containing protein n=1 Tax=Stentor coeruleus TaxID=5963 RepID=A0A1R2C8F5_9CILI|nr:hypothetical protein SteCoe_13383 [Stentor coeruleus]
MDLKLNFLKEFIDPNTTHLIAKTSRSKIKPEPGCQSARRQQNQPQKAPHHSRLFSSDSKTIFLQHLTPSKKHKDYLLNQKPQSSLYKTKDETSKDYLYKTYDNLHNTDNTQNLKISESKTSSKPKSKSKDLSLTEATSKIYEYNNKIWMHKHNSRNNAEGHLIDFANEIFKELDCENLGVVNGKRLVENLLSLGIASDSHVLRETLSLIFDCNDVYKADIDVHDFLALFRRDIVNDKILKNLNEWALDERKKNSVIVERAKKWMGQDSESPLSFFKFKTPMSLAGHDQHISLKKSQDIITINEHLNVIDKIWKKYFRGGDDGISLLTACEAFKYFKIFQDNYECKKFIISSLGQANFLTNRDFQQLFAKSMIKGAFQNLSKRLYEGNYASKEMSPGFKISAYQRSLLMSGVRCPNSSIAIEEGEKTVKALEKFKNYPKITYDELRSRLLKVQGIDEKLADKNELRTRRNRKILNDIRSITSRLFASTSKPNRQLSFKDGKIQFF